METCDICLTKYVWFNVICILQYKHCNNILPLCECVCVCVLDPGPLLSSLSSKHPVCATLCLVKVYGTCACVHVLVLTPL